MDYIYESLVASIDIEDWDRFQRIVEFDKNDFETAPSKSDYFLIIELTLFTGRSKELKKKPIFLLSLGIQQILQDMRQRFRK